MEISKVEKTGTARVSDSLLIRYNITTGANENINRVTANIYKNDVIIGFFNMGANDVTGFSLNEDNGLTAEEITSTFQAAVTDCYSLLKA